jgi:hypothetical protein
MFKQRMVGYCSWDVYFEFWVPFLSFNSRLGSFLGVCSSLREARLIGIADCRRLYIIRMGTEAARNC